MKDFKRLSTKMEKALNEQMMREAFQAQVYLSYASWAELNGFGGVADFLYKHSEEERQHMYKFLRYINDRGGASKITGIKNPPADPKDLGKCLEKIMQHEVDNSNEIYKLVDLALEEKDWATFNFLQWFVKEQIEEETLVSEVLDKYNLAVKQRGNNANLYEFDKDLATADQEATIPREEEL